MPESTVVLLFLGVTSACLVVISGTVFVTAKALRRTLRRLNPMLLHCDQAIREARQTIGQARELLTRTNTTARHVETVVRSACEAATDTLEHLLALKIKAETLFSEYFGNGARGEPRRNARR